MNHKHYMQRAIQLAQNGFGHVSPNPMVGCIIVHNGIVIGEGWHQKFGMAHAEVNAINGVDNKELLKEATVYVTLEPCSYQGKTPACSALLVRYKVKQVVISTLDPNPKVSGNGVKALEKAGIEVVSGVLEKEAIQLNKRFFINQVLNRPYIVLKWAHTSDGFIARKNFDSKWISNEFSRQLVHQWRAEEDAILVGKNTALHDNPSLTVRDWKGTNPVRVVFDRNLELNTSLKLFNGEVKTLLYNCKESKLLDKFELIKIDNDNFIQSALTDLYQRNIGSLIIEGGSQILKTFVELGLWDEARVFSSEQEFGEGIEAPQIREKTYRNEQVEDDKLDYYYNPKTIKHWQKN